MISAEKRTNDRAYFLEEAVAAEYCDIPFDIVSPSDFDLAELPHREYRTALVHNISRGGACISVDDLGFVVGAEIALFITVRDTASRHGSRCLEFVGRIVWILEGPSGFRVGLKFVDVPEDYFLNFDRIVGLVEHKHL